MIIINLLARGVRIKMFSISNDLILDNAMV